MQLSKEHIKRMKKNFADAEKAFLKIKKSIEKSAIKEGE